MSKKDNYIINIDTNPDDSAGNVEPITSIRTVRSKTGEDVNYINANTAHGDEALLAEIGYKQELKRQFSTFQVFGIAFSIMGLLPSIATVLGGGLTGGPVTLIWGWFITGGCILTIGISLAQSASACPTAGGLFYWTYLYTPPKYKVVLSFIIGWANSLALIAGVCSIAYGFAEEVLAAVVIQKDGDFEITNGKTYGVFVGGVVVMVILTAVASTAISRLQTFSIICNCFIIVLLFIALPIGTKINRGGFNDGKFIFGTFENFSDWNNGWQFCLEGFMPACWTIGAFDSCVHQSEEAKDASKAVPVGIIGSITACWVIGWLICICLMACIDPDLERIIDSEYGFALAQIIYDSLGKNWAIAFMSLIAFCQFLMGASIMTAVSRQVYAFARDNGLIFSKYIKMVKTNISVPFNAVLACGFGSLALGLLCLIDTAAANALFSLLIACNYFSWAVTSSLRNTCGKHIFKPGPFYLGKFWGPAVDWFSVLFQCFIIILVMFPSMQHGVTKDTMNYACVIGPGVCILAWVYYITYQKKYYKGPISNLSDDEYIDKVGTDVIDEILSVNAKEQ
ncbi:probable GABA-specific permease [Saccharomycodes ludwigii]|uniref:Probable GABA-specific permease n=1 Tax=Saccharomycodes ludwigii TaxID=36035 RepID=A0A376B3Z4_9ASCO|nr:probable GABA-specific permease [Saccharomycodes ludwigii]